VIGIDHAGHTFFSSHPEIERKITETEKIIEDVI
jgi:hypothetical protein